MGQESSLPPLTSRRAALRLFALTPALVALAACGAGTGAGNAGTTAAASSAPPAASSATGAASPISTSSTATSISSAAVKTVATSSKSAATASATQVVVSHKPGTLLWATPGNDQEYAVYVELAKRYSAAHPKTPVETNRDLANLTKFLANVAAGTGPDVLFITIDQWPGLAGKDAAAPLDDYLARDKFDLNDFFPQIIKPYRFANGRFGSGKLYGLPKEIAVRAMYYNADALRAAGIPAPQPGQPWDWPTYLDHTRHLLKAQGDQTSQWGYVQEIWDGMAMIWAWAAGGNYVDDTWAPTRVTVDSAETIQGVQYWTDFVVKYHVAPTPAQIKVGGGQSTIFAKGHAATYNNGRWMVPQFRQLSTFPWDVMPIPKGPKGQAQLLTGSMFGLYTGSKMLDDAWSLLAYVTGKEGQTLMTQSGLLLPSRQSIARSDTFLKNSPPQQNQTFLDEIPLAQALPMHPKYPQVAKVFNQALSDILTGKKAAADAMRDVASQGTGILKS